MSSPIQDFYKNKTVFLTGGSGFLGKVTIEKLLRSTDVKRLYVLIRQKKGLSMQDRIAAWKDEIVFGQMLKLKPNALKRIVPISGDCMLDDLGISEADRSLLTEEVQVVLHGAATVRFTEPLHLALDINTRAARLMLALAKEMTRLEAYVHISTAFSNCVIDRINECFYPEHLNCSVDKVLVLRDTLGDELIDKVAPVLVGKYPNTYTYTKALAEQVVQQEAGDLPLCIYRPAVIFSSYKEPYNGWIDAINGATPLIFGSALGFVRISIVDYYAKASIVPADYSANLLIALAWRTAAEHATRTKEPLASPRIFNYAPCEGNILNWGAINEKTLALFDIYPIAKMMWYPFHQFTTSKWCFAVMSFFYHIVPAYFIDIALRLKGQKAWVLQKYRKFNSVTKMISFFTAITWHFETRNSDNLFKSMTTNDQKTFNFNMKVLNWDDYLDRSTEGMRVFLGKDDPSPEGLKRSKAIRKRFYILHRMLQLSLSCAALLILWFCLKLLIF